MTLCLGKLGGLVASTTGKGRETNSLEQVGAYAAMPFKIWKKITWLKRTKFIQLSNLY